MTPLLWRTVRGAGLDQVAAEDVVQTVWLTLLRSAGTIRDPQGVVGWLLTAARREAWRVSQRAPTPPQRSSRGFGVVAGGGKGPPAPGDPPPAGRAALDARRRAPCGHERSPS